MTGTAIETRSSMSVRAPQPSKRFLRAAESERTDLIARHQRLAAERDRLQARVDEVADSMLAVEDALRALARVLGESATDILQPDEARPAPDLDAELSGDAGISASRLLKGPAIREVAVQVLLHQPQYIEALHYRDWYELLTAAGYSVGGKDPRAVFLTQITRSPVVRKASEPGIYEVDRQAPLRLRQRFERLQAELRDLASVPAGEAGVSSTGARRRDLTAEIGRTERDLEEALRVLRLDNDSGQRLTA